MISWISFALAALKLVNAIVQWASRRELIEEGRRQAIMEYSLAIAARVATKKQIQEHIDGLTDAQVDAELRELEPK